MRFVITAFVLALTACGQPTTPTATATATAAPAASAPAVEQDTLVGTWSFDRSCASGDGMTLRADGTASYDEWGEGHWVIDVPARVILTLAKSEPGVGPTGQHVMVTLDVTPPVTDDLHAARSFDDGTPASAINARRCQDNQ
ncbi:MAG: hypothetical protein WAU68_13300 [Vitreimonas sp.]